MIEKLFLEQSDSEDQWLSISDIMSGLMMIFLFIAVIYMIDVQQEKDEIKQVAETYESLQISLYNDLYNEFKDDLKRWNAEINAKTLSIRFNEPDILFEAGESAIKENFKFILSDFFPRYLNILQKQQYKDSIEEIRIEGHTSSEWGFEQGITAYFKNMELSQDRTRSVLEYVLLLDNLDDNRNWLIQNLTANGLSSSKLIIEDNIEKKERSRRVEFRVRTDSENQIYKIIGKEE